MKTKMLTKFFLLVVILSGCSRLNQTTNQPTPEATFITESPPMQIPGGQETTPDLGKVGVTFNFYSAPGSELHQEQVPSICTGPEKLTETEFIQSSGLVILDTSTKNLLVLDDMGFGEPIYAVKPKSPDSILAEWSVSPDGEWMSYLDYTNVHLFNAWVENVKTGEKISKHFEGITIGSQNVYWANNHQIVIPLRNEGDYFQWIVWNPFVQSEDIVSARLTNIGKSFDGEYALFNIYNPNTDKILYVCEQCGDNEYQIYDLNRDEIVESIDFGEGLFNNTEWTPYFTPGMQYIAFHFGGNKIWIFDENGESLLKVTMPFVDYLSWTGRTFKWSNDGKYLAMFRENPGTPQYYLSILDVEHRTIKNLCAQIPPSTLQWSHDNHYIIAMSNRSADDTEGTLSIIDVNTGEGETMTIIDDGYLVGWLEP